MTVRVYIPLTIGLLRTAVAAAEIRPADGLVFAVTAGLRGDYPTADDEELEYLAMADAARASLALLAGEAGRNGFLRVVAAADVEALAEAPHRDRSAATVAGTIPWRRVASVHLDGAEAAEVVRTAALALDAADLGDPDAELAVGDAEDVDLSWYAPGEVAFLLADLDALE